MATDFNETPGTARYRKPAGGSLGQMWKNPIVKLGVVIVVGGGVALAAGQYINNRPKQENSVIPVAQATSPTSTSTEVTPQYQAAINAADQLRAEQAKARGGSVIPTPMQNPVATPTLEAEANAPDTSSPLSEFENMLSAQGTPPQQQAPQQQVAPQIPAQPTYAPEAIQAATNGMRRQIELLMGIWEPTSMRIQGGDETSLANAESAIQQVATKTTAETTEEDARVIVNAGQIYYGQMLMEANSDIPGPIMAQILTGPLAGGRAIGSFETFRNHLLIRFNTVAIKNDQLSVDILALDPDTTLGGVVTEVDPRYFTRVLLPAAAEFIRAYGDTISQPDTTTSVTSGGISTSTSSGNNSPKDAMYDGISSAADRIGQFTDEEAAATKRLVRVAVGTPIGLFFVSPVKENLK